MVIPQVTAIAVTRYRVHCAECGTLGAGDLVGDEDARLIAEDHREFHRDQAAARRREQMVDTPRGQG